MQRSTFPRRALSAAVLALALVGAAPAQDLLSSTEAPAAVRVVANAAADQAVTGTVQNTTGATLTSVQLIVRHDWLWRNEESPGTDDPGWTDTLTINTEIPPGSSYDFTYQPSSPVPARDDGHFVTRVRVGAYTTVSEGVSEDLSGG